MRPIDRSLAWLLWLLMASGPGAAGVQPAFADVMRRYTSEDGLPQNSITDMAQTPDGFLWLATYGGLVRFDGLDFVVHRSLGDQGPSSNRILSLHVDRRDRLWIGTEDGGISLLADGSFVRLPACAGRCSIRGFVEEDGRIWAMSGVGLLRIDPDSLETTQVDAERYEWGERIGERLYFGQFEQAWEWRDGRRWPLPAPDPGSTTMISGMGTLDGDLWIGTDRSFRRFDPATRTWRDDDAATVPAVTYALRDRQGRLWLADNVNGLFVAEGGGTPRRVQMPRSNIRGLLLDNEGNLWIGSNGSGLFRRRPPQIGLLNAAAGGLDQAAMPVAGDGSDGLWIGMVCGGIRHWNARTGEVRRWEVPGTASACPWSLLDDGDGTLWIGSTDGQLGRLRAGDARIATVARWPQRISIRAIHRDRDALLLATDSGVQRLVLDASGTPRGAPEAVPALGGTLFNSILPARTGGHWFAGYDGVYRLQDGRIAEHWHPGNGLSSRFARALHEDADGVLWVGTYGGGLNRIADGQVRSYGQHNGLFDDVVSCILEDADGQLWLSGNRGIFVLPVEQRQAMAAGADTVHSIGYSASDGLVPDETNGGGQPACHRGGDGRMWFPLISGLAVVDPTRLRPLSRHAPATRIERITAAGRPMPLAHALAVPAGTGDIEVGFTAINFSAPERTRFRYRLGEGPWIDIGAIRKVHFPVVPWGEHTLEIAASSETGRWSETPARLLLSNPPPWHMRPLPLAAVAALLLCALSLLWRLRTLRLRQHSHALALLVGERTAALEQANRQLAEQAHSDPLTGVGNHRHFAQALESGWNARIGSGGALALLLIDVDQFKGYNDHFGHLAGDDALRAIAHGLQRGLRSGEILARYGGEEFVVLLHDRPRQDAVRAAERLREAVVALDIAHYPGARHDRVTISVGVACLAPDRHGAHAQLVERADRALYRAKAGGRNRTECWDAAAER